MSIKGASASVSEGNPGATRTGSNLAEVDLEIDPQGDLLAIDHAGDVLIASAVVTWAGTTASRTV